MNHAKHNSVSFASLLVACAVAAGCSTVKAGFSAVRSDYAAWNGHPASELIESWGPPDETAELASDYLAYTWLGDDGGCRRTFMARAGTITGFSETDCQE